MSEREPISGSSRDYGSTAAPPTVGFADFSPTELYNLSEGIADNINAINSGLRSLEKMMKQIGGPNDSVQLRDKIHDAQQNVNGSVSATARDIQRLGVIVRRGDKPQKLQVERLTQAFRDALEKYSTVQKQVSEKMAAFMPSKPRVRNDPRFLEQQAAADDEEAALLANQQAQARLVQFETSMLLEREAQLSKIEADVLDVNQIMQDLAEMVSAQAQTVDTVESHIEAAGASVEAGVDELAKAAEYQRRYRRKMFIFITIGLIIGILLIVWIIKAFR
ncbi:PREDICTED: syntaxin-12 [Papilio xuthus]|uniref:Syntaxin-12 n=1 Tax=Papilio xuthus TaxID=66420 RepID=A0A194QD83_PAPXU|nr:PREDICTED: syntaxin-12 [Papilio xuthus]XP_013166161.1 PREDICTED: syntaxin-12 [Papilio xuthus]XP_013166162.1 PREDICTED: syntaxin-12 [Papilio xuthus]XP_013166163.1 PREDICTED: syntaxin-12 [Papilio xuthus]XP_013166164.1 PREDICTED: syntaxin-12 [Papilio xuthus]KPJ03503.1 t-SNARE domain-containing protein 1 [Papilio xuthus]